MQTTWVYLSIHRSVRVCDQFPNLRHNMLKYVYVEVWMHLPQVLLEVSKTQFVSILIFPIVIRIFLHGIVCQVNEFVMDILYIEFFARSSNIGIFIEVTFEMSIYTSHKAVAAEVEFSTMNKQGIIDVFLDDKSLILSVTARILYGSRSIHNYVSDLIEVRANFNSLTTIRIFTWFNYPDVSLEGIPFFYLLHDFIRLNYPLFLF